MNSEASGSAAPAARRSTRHEALLQPIAAASANRLPRCGAAVNRTLPRQGALPDLLLLAPGLPSPADSGDRLRWYHLLKFLGQRYRVHLGCFIGEPYPGAIAGKVKALCYETCFVDQPVPASRLRSLGGGEARAVRACHSAVLADWIARLQRRHALHAALACSAPMARHLAPLGDVLRLVDFVEVESERGRQLASTRRWPMASMWRREAGQLREHERAVAHQCDSLFFASPDQADLFRALAADAAHKVEVLPGGVDADYFSPHILQRSPFAAGARVLVLGTPGDGPHADAAAWFAREVFAPLRARDPGLQLCIVTARPGGQAHALVHHQGVVLAGAVHDPRPYLAHAALVVAPLQRPHGAPHCVLEAMAMQKPVVASPAALAGVRARPDTEVLVAADAVAFRRRIESLLASRGAPELGKAARACVTREHGWDAGLAALARRLELPPSRLAGAS